MSDTSGSRYVMRRALGGEELAELRRQTWQNRIDELKRRLGIGAGASTKITIHSDRIQIARNIYRFISGMSKKYGNAIKWRITSNVFYKGSDDVISKLDSTKKLHRFMLRGDEKLDHADVPSRLSSDLGTYLRIVEECARLSGLTEEEEKYQLLASVFDGTGYMPGEEDAAVRSPAWALEHELQIRDIAGWVDRTVGLGECFRRILKDGLVLCDDGSWRQELAPRPQGIGLQVLRSTQEPLEEDDLRYLPRVTLYRQRVARVPAIRARGDAWSTLPAELQDDFSAWPQEEVHIEAWRHVELALVPFGATVEVRPAFIQRSVTLVRCRPAEDGAGDEDESLEDADPFMSWGDRGDIVGAWPYWVPWRRFADEWVFDLCPETLEDLPVIYDDAFRMDASRPEEMPVNENNLRGIRFEAILATPRASEEFLSAPLREADGSQRTHCAFVLAYDGAGFASPPATVAAALEAHLHHASLADRIDERLCAEAERLCRSVATFERERDARLEARRQALREHWRDGTRPSGDS